MHDGAPGTRYQRSRRAAAFGIRPDRRIARLIEAISDMSES